MEGVDPLSFSSQVNTQRGERDMNLPRYTPAHPAFYPGINAVFLNNINGLTISGVDLPPLEGRTKTKTKLRVEKYIRENALFIPCVPLHKSTPEIKINENNIIKSIIYNDYLRGIYRGADRGAKRGIRGRS